MGWQTNLFCNITFNRETFNTIYEVEDKIDDLNKCIKICKDNIRNLVIMTEPNKFCPEDYDVMSWISNEYKENLELIEEYTIELYKLNLLLNNWDVCHNEKGLAIDPPKEIKWNTAFLDGDFIKTINHPTSNEIF